MWDEMKKKDSATKLVKRYFKFEYLERSLYIATALSLLFFSQFEIREGKLDSSHSHFINII